MRGQLPADLCSRSLAIVGTRNVTSYGQRMAKHLAEAAAYSSFVVVSGLAFGVDVIAHKAALDAGGESISVLGGGLARIQPQEHVPLAREIAAHGAVISEFPMEFSPTRHSFPMRNRIISGLCKGTLVIEAGLNSGSLITAALANEQGRPVYGVPGNIDNVTSLGVNMLIRDGAQPLIAVDDLLADLQVDRSAVVQQELKSVTGAEEQQILALLARGSEVTVDQLAAMTGLTAGRINGLVSVLEMKGLVMTALGRVFLAV